MRIFNKTKNKLVAEHVEVAKTFKEKSEGLLKYETPHAMYFETQWGTCPVPYAEHKTFAEKLKHILRNAIRPVVDFPLLWCGVHTCGMKFPIDAIVLGERNVVKKVKRDMQSGRFFFWNPKYKKILELPAGSNIETGDVLELTK